MANDDLGERIPKEAAAQGDGAIKYTVSHSCGRTDGQHDAGCTVVEVITPKPGPHLDAYVRARKEAEGAPAALSTAAVNLHAALRNLRAARGWQERRNAKDQVSIWRATLEIAAIKYAEARIEISKCQDALIADALTDPEHPERGPAPEISAADAAAGKFPH